MTNNPSAQPPRSERAAWVRHGAAILLVAAALGLRAAFDKFLGDAHPFPFFLAAIVVAAWFGGLGPALLALVLGYFVADWFFIPPRGNFTTITSLGLFSVIIYVFNGLVMSVAVSAARQAAKRQREDAALIHREYERFRVTLLAIGDAVIATDAKGIITFMNPVAEKITGWTQQEASGKPLRECFKIRNELTRKPVDDPVAKVLRDGNVIGLANHTILVSKNGQEIPIDDSAAPIRSLDGQLIGTILVFRDVSEQRAAEHAMRRLAAIVESSDDAILAKDLNGIITSWNKGAERIFGFSATEILGQSTKLLVPADRQSEEQDILARLRHGERIDHLQTIRKTKDGRHIDVSLSISPIRDSEGHITGASTIAREITERERAELALRESNARNTSILESALDAIIVIDHESKILEFNPAAEKIFGFTRAEVIGQSMAERIIPERFRAQHYRGLAHYLATGQGPVLRKRLELPAIRANGEEFPAELAIIPVPGSQPPTFTGFLRDLTDVKQAEQALKNAQEDLLKANRSLESKVQERTASLEQSLKSMETVLYTIAHDLRSPNRAMQGFSQLLAAEYGSQLDENARSYLDRISNAALKNDALICDLLEYGRLAHAQLPMANIDLGETIKKVLQDLHEQIRSKNAALDVAERIPSVWANDSVLTQILTNLLTNAMKFVPPGVPPRVRIWTEPAENPKSIGLTRPVESKMVRIFIRDSGIGIPSDVQERLFQPFQRGTSEPRYQGTGMGLAIVQKGAERLGGKVGFDSPPGQGTTFWLELFSARPIELKSAHEPENPASR